jgi:cytoskeletal protein CcmA (bactofilin family)
MKITKKQLVTTLLASTFMAFASTAIATPVNIAAGDTHVGDLSTESTVTLGAGAVVCGDIDAPTVTLGANASVSGNIVEATTVTLGANAYALGNVSATTLTLGAEACYGGLTNNLTITSGAGAFQCGSSQEIDVCDAGPGPEPVEPNEAHYNNHPYPHGTREDGLDHWHVEHIHD